MKLEPQNLLCRYRKVTKGGGCLAEGGPRAVDRSNEPAHLLDDLGLLFRVHAEEHVASRYGRALAPHLRVEGRGLRVEG